MKIRAIVKQIRKELYIIYRRFMRTVARFILGFERCPREYQKRYKEGAITVLCGFLVMLISAAGFILLIILFA